MGQAEHFERLNGFLTTHTIAGGDKTFGFDASPVDSQHLGSAIRVGQVAVDFS